jgi:hypothetical protein
VQRDLLPIIEGSVVSTKYGNVATDHILFICSGAFHSCKPSDMLAELQGRLPIRVELQGLTCAPAAFQISLPPRPRPRPVHGGRARALALGWHRGAPRAQEGGLHPHPD